MLLVDDNTGSPGRRKEIRVCQQNDSELSRLFYRNSLPNVCESQIIVAAAHDTCT